jgi:hypothetical protein
MSGLNAADGKNTSSPNQRIRVPSSMRSFARSTIGTSPSRLICMRPLPSTKRSSPRTGKPPTIETSACHAKPGGSTEKT